MDGQCGKLVTVVGHQFITLIVHICVRHVGHEAPHCVGLSASAETCFQLIVAASIMSACTFYYYLLF